MARLLILASVLATMSSTISMAASVTVAGRIVRTQGHTSPSCRTVSLRNTSGSIMLFRIQQSSPGVDDTIAATALTAVATGYPVLISYDPAITSGCGAEPRIDWIEIQSPNQ